MKVFLEYIKKHKLRIFQFLITFFIVFFVYLTFSLYFDFFSVFFIFYLFLFTFFMFFSILYFIKNIKMHTLNQQILSEIPFFLINISNDLDKNFSLKNTLENRVDNTIIGKKIKHALNLVKNYGFTLNQALDKVSQDNKDLNLVFYQLQDVFSLGGKERVNSLNILCDSFIEKQINNFRNSSSKINFLSLIFIVTSAIIPAIFLIFTLVGSNFLEISFNAFTIIIFTIVIFPIIDMFILLIMKSRLV